MSAFCISIRKQEFIHGISKTKKAVRVGQPSISVFNWTLLFAIAVHPALVIVPAAVFFRCKACGLLENLDEVGLG